MTMDSRESFPLYTQPQKGCETRLKAEWGPQGRDGIPRQPLKREECQNESNFYDILVSKSEWIKTIAYSRRQQAQHSVSKHSTSCSLGQWYRDMKKKKLLWYRHFVQQKSEWSWSKRLPCERSRPTEAKFPETERKAGLLWRETTTTQAPAMKQCDQAEAGDGTDGSMPGSRLHMWKKSKGVSRRLICTDIKLKHAVIQGANRFESSACTKTKSVNNIKLSSEMDKEKVTHSEMPWKVNLLTWTKILNYRKQGKKLSNSNCNTVQRQRTPKIFLMRVSR